MTATRSAKNLLESALEPSEKPETVLGEEIDVSLHPDRAHHDELGRTAEFDEHHEPGQREQPAGPIDIGRVDE